MSLIDLTERDRAVAQTGRWWEPPWWRLPGALPDRFNPDTIDVDVAELAALFDSSWMKSVADNHPLKDAFARMRGLHVEELNSIAQGLCVLREAEGDSAWIRERLLNPAEYVGARRELETVWLLGASDLKLRISRRAAPGADVRTVGASKDFAVEVTGVTVRQAEERVSDFLGEATMLLSRATFPRAFSAQLTGQRVLALKDAPALPSRLAEMRGELWAAAIAGRELADGNVFSVPGIGEVTIKDTGGSDATGPDVDSARMAGKAVSSAVKKERQLPQGMSGVIVVEVPIALFNVHHVARALHQKLLEYKGKTARIAGVVYFARWRDGDGARLSLWAVDNPNAETPLRDLPWELVNRYGRAWER